MGCASTAGLPPDARAVRPTHCQKLLPLSRLDATVTVAPAGVSLPAKGALFVLLGPAARASDRNASATVLACMSRRQGWPLGLPRGKSVNTKRGTPQCSTNVVDQRL